MNVDEMHQRWGVNISEHRNKLGMSQRHLAELVGVTQAAVSQWERAEWVISDRNRVAVAEALGQPIQSLFPY